ncbi:hypothetical protein ACRAWF_15350 [Streptomyces sp. L7]
MLAQLSGRLEEAVQLLGNAVAAHRATGDDISAVSDLLTLAMTQIHLGDPQAAQLCHEALAFVEAHDARLLLPYALYALGYDAWRRGDAAQTLIRVRSALEHERRFERYGVVVVMLEQLAWATTAVGHHREAGRLLGVAGGLWQDIGTTISTFGPHAAEQHIQCKENVVRALGKEAFEVVFAEGARHRAPPTPSPMPCAPNRGRPPRAR